MRSRVAHYESNYRDIDDNLAKMLAGRIGACFTGPAHEKRDKRLTVTRRVLGQADITSFSQLLEEELLALQDWIGGTGFNLPVYEVQQEVRRIYGLPADRQPELPGLEAT